MNQLTEEGIEPGVDKLEVVTMVNHRFQLLDQLLRRLVFSGSFNCSVAMVAFNLIQVFSWWPGLEPPPRGPPVLGHVVSLSAMYLYSLQEANS